MKKLSKVLMCAAVAAVLGSGLAFAKGRDGDFRGKEPAGRMEIAPDGTMAQKVDLIGKVTAVDEKNGTIKVADLDGKETVIYVNSFTHIRVDDSKDEKTISDIKKDAWIMYSLYNTETEKKLASRILVKIN